MSIAPEEGGATLNDTYELLKRELALEGNVSDVVAQACRALGVSPEGSIMDRAARCRAALLGGGSQPQPAVVQGTILETAAPVEAQVLGVAAPNKAQFFAVAPSRFQVSLYSPPSEYLTNDHFGQSRSPVPWTIEIVEGRTVRLQGANGLYLRSDGREGSPPAWTTEPDRTTEWHLLFHGDGSLPNDDTPVQLKSPSNGGREMCLCNDLPTGGWGGFVKNKYSWCPEGRGDAFWRFMAWREEDGDAHFLPCAAFAGSRPGFAFLNGAKGLGYYRELWPGAAAMERGDLISPSDLDAAGTPFCAGQSCWVGIVCRCVPWCGTLRAVDADTCFPRRPLAARRRDPRLARYARDFQCCLSELIPYCGRQYRRSPGSNRFLWTGPPHLPGHLAEKFMAMTWPRDADWEYFTNKDFAYGPSWGSPWGVAWRFRVC